MGAMSMVISKASPRRIRAGTSWVPKMGITIRKLARRNSGQRCWPTHWPITSALISAGIIRQPIR
jgi:hypothetical protein